MSALEGFTTCPSESCGDPIRYVLTEHGSRLAIEPDPHPDGTVVVHQVGDGRVRARILTGEQLPAQVTAWRRHDAVCPDGRTARRRKAATTPRCRVCRLTLHQLAVDAGWTTHPLCGPPEDFRALVEAAATSTQETPS